MTLFDLQVEVVPDTLRGTVVVVEVVEEEEEDLAMDEPKTIEVIGKGVKQANEVEALGKSSDTSII